MFDSADSSDITFTSGSRLLSESPPAPSSSSNSHSQTGHGGDDLSISELSLADRPTPQPSNYDHSSDDPFNDDSVDGIADTTALPQSDEQTRRQAAKLREEKLQRDLFILKKLNSSFALFNDALKDTKTGTEVCCLMLMLSSLLMCSKRVAEQLENTNDLLDKYVNILSKSETATRLIFDERWDGAEQVSTSRSNFKFAQYLIRPQDEVIIEREQKEKAEKARREAQERALAAQRERERAEREEQEAREREEKERIAQERKERTGTRGVRGVRGTRASMRGVKSASTTGTRGGKC